MAEVYAGRVRGEAGFEKLVAVKRMLPALADDDAFVAMFLDEARLAANINSPHCVHTLDLGRAADGSLFIVMELVVGVTLAHLLRSAMRTGEPTPLEVGLGLLGQAADGLHDAHIATTPVGAALGIVHRDVSPQNILVGTDGRVRLTDFGVARAVMRATQTVAGQIKGKFAYGSPEQLAGDEIDQRSDVFSLGIVAWELLAGQRLFLGDHPMETMERVRSMPVPLLHSLRADVPPGVSAAIAWALERDLGRRAPTARAFATELRRAAAGDGVAVAGHEDIAFHVARGGGRVLAKMRQNIQLALSNNTDFVPLPEGAEALHTPSGVKSVPPPMHLSPGPFALPIEGHGSSPSSPSASPRSGGSTTASVPMAPARFSGWGWVFAGLLAAALVGGGAVVAYTHGSPRGPVSEPLPVVGRPVVSPSMLAPEAVAAQEEDPARGGSDEGDVDAIGVDAVDSDAVDSDAVDSDAVDSDAVDSDAVDPGPSAELEAQVDSTVAEPPRRRARVRRPAPRPSTVMDVVAPQGESAGGESEAAAGSVHRERPSPGGMATGTARERTTMGLLGVDQFDQSLRER
jgi:serine/threonine-protein kinase